MIILKNTRKIIAAITLFLVFPSLQAQSTSVEMADLFREQGKIYVVIAVIFVLFAALITYLFVVDRKVKKLEDKVDELDQE
jgi:uncharacterized membrane protein (DUF106 family)